MKTVGQALKKTKDKVFSSEDKLVHCIHTHKGYRTLESPIKASQMECIFCGHKQGYTCLINENTRSWICGRVCPSSKLPKYASSTTTPLKPQRAILWPSFCENNGIGDRYHDVKFELMDQSKGKIDYLKKFCEKPNGIVLMYGPAGTGKTYACMGLCELYTRKKSTVKFFTHRTLATQWLATFKEERDSGFIQKIETINLLVIDDFGTSDPTPAFLTFFMDLINSRMQWKDRGTVITTNLSPSKLSEVCGDALSDRLKTAQQFVFAGQSRREPPIL